MNTKIKTYKILVDSKPFANIRCSTPAEVAKKAASKILVNSLNRVRFSIVEAKTGKFRHYDAKLENLVRPYHKNGKLVKYRIVVKKLGKQIGGTYPPDLGETSVDPIFTFFPKGEYEIKVNSDENNSEINFLVPPLIKYHIRSNTGNTGLCIVFHFEIDEKKIKLDNLNKCYDKSGSVNLNKIIEYGKYLKSQNIIDKIELLDASTLYDEKISLALLSILSTGMSWYNSFGFFSSNSEVEKENNSKFLKMKFNEFLDLCIDILYKQKKYYYDLLGKKMLESKLLNKKLNKNLSERELKEELLKYIMEELNAEKEKFIDKFGNLTVQQVFTNIKEKLKSQKLSEQELNIERMREEMREKDRQMKEMMRNNMNNKPKE
jgi:hypothetical protein